MARPDADAEEEGADERPGRHCLHHHGNLREALVEATCKLIEKKGALGFTAAPPLTDAAFGRRHDRAGGAGQQQTSSSPPPPRLLHIPSDTG